MQLLFPPSVHGSGTAWAAFYTSGPVAKEVSPCSFAPATHTPIALLPTCVLAWHPWKKHLPLFPILEKALGERNGNVLLLPKGSEDTAAASPAGVRLSKPRTKYLITDFFSSSTASSNQNPPNSCRSPREEHFIYWFLPLGKLKYLKTNLARPRHERT